MDNTFLQKSPTAQNSTQIACDVPLTKLLNYLYLPILLSCHHPKMNVAGKKKTSLKNLDIRMQIKFNCGGLLHEEFNFNQNSG